MNCVLYPTKMMLLRTLLTFPPHLPSSYHTPPWSRNSSAIDTFVKFTCTPKFARYSDLFRSHPRASGARICVKEARVIEEAECL